MSPDQAVQILTFSAKQAKLSYDEHLNVQNASDILVAFIQQTRAAQEAKKEVIDTTEEKALS